MSGLIPGITKKHGNGFRLQPGRVPKAGRDANLATRLPKNGSSEADNRSPPPLTQMATSLQSRLPGNMEAWLSAQHVGPRDPSECAGVGRKAFRASARLAWARPGRQVAQQPQVHFRAGLPCLTPHDNWPRGLSWSDPTDLTINKLNLHYCRKFSQSMKSNPM